MATRVSYERATAKIRALGNVLKRPLRDVLDSGAKVLSISLAKSTQPSRGEGTGAESLAIGEKALTRDIWRVYGGASKAWQAIGNSRLKGAFWRHYKAGHFSKAEDVARDAGLDVGNFDGGAKHRAARRTRRPIILQHRPSYFCIRPAEIRKIEAYVKLMKREVGKAKGAWADVSRALGANPRGLRTTGDITASWITGKGHGYGKFFRGGSDQNPSIRITSSVDYARQVLSTGAENYAKGIARHRMIENLQHAVKAETKNLRAAA